MLVHATDQQRLSSVVPEQVLKLATAVGISPKSHLHGESCDEIPKQSIPVGIQRWVQSTIHWHTTCKLDLAVSFAHTRPGCLQQSSLLHGWVLELALGLAMELVQVPVQAQVKVLDLELGTELVAANHMHKKLLHRK